MLLDLTPEGGREAPFASSAPTARPGLEANALAWLEGRFQVTGHTPSPDQWEAIRDLLRHLQACAHGQTERAVYVSAIPAGTGKSTSLQAFAWALCGDAGHEAVGMLILVNRIEELEAMAVALSDHRDRLGLIVGKANTTRVAGLAGQPDANAAQIVIATQASLKETLRATGKGFDDLTRFHYRGARRAVVCWDEAIAFNRPVVIDGDAVGGLAKVMRDAGAPLAADELKRWVARLIDVSSGPCDVPDFESLGLDFRRLEEIAATSDDTMAQARALEVASGEQVYVHRDNLQGPVMLSHVPEVPNSLLPVTVTDASAARGVHHASYDQMAASGIRIIRLKEAAKTYRNLTIRIVPTAASRSVFHGKKGNGARDLIDMAVRYVQSLPAGKEVLIVSYKGRFVMRGVQERTISDAINARLSGDDRGRVHHLTYGNHTATNRFGHIEHVLLLGLNFRPYAASHAAAGAALGMPMASDDPADHPTRQQIEDMRLGMLRDTTLQAMLRGRARISVSGDCGRMEVVIAQVRQTGLSMDDYRGMFPGVVIRQDRTLMPERPLKGRLKELADLVSRLIEVGEREIANPDLYGHLGMKPSNFSALIKKSEWQEWTKRHGLIPVIFKGNVRGLRAVSGPSML